VFVVRWFWEVVVLISLQPQRQILRHKKLVAAEMGKIKSDRSVGDRSPNGEICNYPGWIGQSGYGRNRFSLGLVCHRRLFSSFSLIRNIWHIMVQVYSAHLIWNTFWNRVRPITLHWDGTNEPSSHSNVTKRCQRLCPSRGRFDSTTRTENVMASTQLIINMLQAGELTRHITTDEQNWPSRKLSSLILLWLLHSIWRIRTIL
jgi:hypothetical protein